VTWTRARICIKELRDAFVQFTADISSRRDQQIGMATTLELSFALYYVTLNGSTLSRVNVGDGLHFTE